jgi:hypothetical protein
METWLKIAETFGIAVAMLAFMLWWVYRIFERVSRRLDQVEDYQRDRLESLIVDSTRTMQASTETMKSLCVVLGDRPCIAREMDILKKEAG